MEKKLYWLVESNDGDLSITCQSLETCSEIIQGDFESIDPEEQKEAEYIITPVWYTDEEYENLPEAN